MKTSYDPTAKFELKVSEVEFRRTAAGRQLMARVYQPVAQPGGALQGVVEMKTQRAALETERVADGVARVHLVGLSLGAAIGLSLPPKRITVNLAPAGLRKEGSGFDLPIALAVLAASHQIPIPRLEEHASVGELAITFRISLVAVCCSSASLTWACAWVRA